MGTGQTSRNVTACCLIPITSVKCLQATVNLLLSPPPGGGGLFISSAVEAGAQ